MADNNLTTKEEFLLNPVEEHNITDAAIASFETNLKHPLKVTVPITPQQDLHGYDHPWPGGGGKNICKTSNLVYALPSSTVFGNTTPRTFTPNSWFSSLTSNNYYGAANAPSDPVVSENLISYICKAPAYGINIPILDLTVGETYTLSANCSIGRIGAAFYMQDGTYISASSLLNGSSTFSIPESTYFTVLLFNVSADTSNGTEVVFTDIQLELGSTATNYVPYENICSIEGLTECKIRKTGVNLISRSDIVKTIQNLIIGAPSVNVPPDGSFVLPEGSYTFQVSENQTAIYVVGGETGTIKNVYNNNISKFTNPKNQAVKIYLWKSNIPAGYWDTINIWLTKGSTAIDFVPYAADPIPISWKHAEGTYRLRPVQEGIGSPSFDNVQPITPALTLTRDDNSTLTVWGGTITFNDDGTSALNSIYAYLDCKAISWIILTGSTSEIKYFANQNSNDITKCKYTGGGITAAKGSEKYSHGTIENPYNNKLNCAYVFERTARIGFSTDSGINTIEQFNDWLASQTQVQLVYPAETNIIYNLSIAETQRAIAALGDKVTTTVYDGSVILNEDGSADVVSEWVLKEYDGSPDENWIFSTSNRAYITVDPLPLYIRQEDGHIICNRLRGIRTTASTSPNVAFVYGTSTIGIHTNQTLTSDNLREWLQNNPLQICYELATPQTYHFPNVGQLKAFLGENNVWSDIGNINVKYLTQHSETGLEYRGDRALELRRRAMMADAPTIHTTVGSEETGGLASFKSYVKAPVKKIEIPFYPKQDLHGYDHPWPGGSEKNLFPYPFVDTTKTVNGITFTDLGNGQIKVSGTSTASGYTNFILQRGIDFGSEYHNFSYVSKTYTVDGKTLDMNGLVSGIGGYYSDGTVVLRVTAGTTVNCTVSPMIYDASSPLTSFVPYANICPIEGYDECEVLDTGANLFDADTLYAEYKQDDGSFIASGGTFTTKRFYIPSKFIGHELTFSAYLKKPEGSSITNMRVRAFVGDKQFNGNLTNSTTYQLSSVTFTPETDRDNVVVSYGNYGGHLMQVTDVQLELGSTVTEFEEYRGKNIPLIFNQAGDHEITPIQDGTGDPSPENVRPIHPGLTFTRDDDSVLSVYGGTLTVNANGTGNISSKYDSAQIKNFGWTRDTASAAYHAFYGQNTQIANSNIYCDIFKYVGNRSYGDWRVEGTYNYGIGRLSSDGRIVIREDSKANVSALTAAYGENWIVYPVATPTTYTLSVTETNRALEALGLTRHIGPLYGGTITINPDGSADVVVTVRKVILDGSQSPVGNQYLVTDNAVSRYFILSPSTPITAPGLITNEQVLASDRFNLKTVGIWGAAANNYVWCYTINGRNQLHLTFSNAALGITTDSGSADVNAAIKTWLTDNPCEFILPLNSSDYQTYHFSNLEQLKVWLGENNFWCDISDDITVKYLNRG